MLPYVEIPTCCFAGRELLNYLMTTKGDRILMKDRKMVQDSISCTSHAAQEVIFVTLRTE